MLCQVSVGLVLFDLLLQRGTYFGANLEFGDHACLSLNLKFVMVARYKCCIYVFRLFSFNR